MNRAFIVAWRELRNYLQDKADLAFSLLLPVVTFALIYGAFGGAGLFHGTAYIVNEDTDGIYAKRLLDNIAKQESLELEILFRDDAEGKLERSDLNMVFLIPAYFSDKLTAGQPVELTIMQRGNGGQEGQIVASIIRGVVGKLNQDFTASKQVSQSLTGRNIPSEKIIITTQQFLDKERKTPLVSVTEVAVGTKPNIVKQFLPGIITMYVLFAISLSATAIVEERRKGTLERLLTTRLTSQELFFGKYLASTLRGFVQTSILLVLSYVVFQIFTPLSFLQSLLIALLFVMSSSTIGLVIASVARTQDAATWIGVFITMSMTMLGGTFFEISKGTTLYTISKFSLNTYANNALVALMNEGSISTLGLEIAVMVGVTVVGLIVSHLLFKALPKGK